CSSCGIVLRDKVEGSPDLRKYSQDDIESRSRTGMPTSLAFRDIGLSTFISYSNVDANGFRINSEQVNKVKRMRHLNRISNNSRSHDRNLKNAFAILSSLKGKLSHITIVRLLRNELSKADRFVQWWWHLSMLHVEN
ncbi:MAG: hypothetical protein WA323_06885, partial [Candidatus Nitrosopolaris sp.]